MVNKFIVNNIFSRFGCPRAIICDGRFILLTLISGVYLRNTEFTIASRLRTVGGQGVYSCSSGLCVQIGRGDTDEDISKLRNEAYMQRFLKPKIKPIMTSTLIEDLFMFMTRYGFIILVINSFQGNCAQGGMVHMRSLKCMIMDRS